MCGITRKAGLLGGYAMRKHSYLVRLVVLVGLFAVSSFIACPSDVRSDKAPKSGTFEGVYHKNPFGLCEFRGFLVDPKLDAQLSKYDGKPIRLEAKKIEQPGNPGPAIIVEIGEITLLDIPPMIEIELKAPSIVLPNTPLVIHVNLVNSFCCGKSLFEGGRAIVPLVLAPHVS
jgi:hypothetical protein